MPTYARYKPSKTQLTLAETKELLESYKKENAKLKAELGDAQFALKWTRDKLIEVQEQNRQLGMTITFLSENKGEKR